LGTIKPDDLSLGLVYSLQNFKFHKIVPYNEDLIIDVSGGSRNLERGFSHGRLQHVIECT